MAWPWKEPQKPKRRRWQWHYAEAFGERKTISAWAKDPRAVVAFKTLRKRILEGGMTPEKAITTPCDLVKRRASMASWSADSLRYSDS